MKCARRVWLTTAVTTAITASFAVQPATAAVHVHGGGHGHVVVGGGFYHPWFGYGFGPYWGWGWGRGMHAPGWYGPPGGIDINHAMMAGYGAIELKAKPDRADVWADGKYFGEARDLDGYPSYLWLADGAHRLQVYKGGFKTFDEKIAVHRGVKTTIKVRLEPGESQPPGTKPSDTSDERKHGEKKY
jgi:hypothetical protein